MNRSRLLLALCLPSPGVILPVSAFCKSVLHVKTGK
jgi:hypothetical protein